MLNISTLLGKCMPVKIAICDDTEEFADGLKSEIENICAKKDWPLETEVFYSSLSLLNADLSSFHVLFLDIDMPDLNGLETARKLREKYKRIILVFVTAFVEYAPAGYKVDAFRYPLKQQINEDLPFTMEEIAGKLSASAETIIVEGKAGTKLVRVENILYIEGTPYRRTRLHMDNSADLIEADGRLSDFEARLHDSGFLKIQRSYIVNMAQISRISSYRVILKSGEALKASESYYKQVQASFLRWKGQHL